MAKLSVSNIYCYDGKVNETLTDKGKAFERERRKAMGLKV